MNRRDFVRLLLGAPAAALSKLESEPPPPHECVDRPSLPCPACLKCTGDPYATVRSNPQCFPGIKVP
jgi:hypothetical protein